MNNLTEMDPLNAYNYTYQNYNPLSHNGYMYNMKSEQPQPLTSNVGNQYAMLYPPQYSNNERLLLEQTSYDNEENNVQNQPPEEVDTKEHIQLLPDRNKKVVKKKGKTSSYWNKKVDDKNFPFYGCTICNVSFKTIIELDEHVTKHKGRLTSYDIRLRNQKKRKQKIKQLKKMKKLGKKIKKEKGTEKSTSVLDDIEIKPEEGYIGNETASEFNNGQKNNDTQNENVEMNKDQSENVVNNTNVQSLDSKPKDKSSLNKEKETEDPRLQKLFKCFACHKQFALSYYLKLHVRSHTDEKPYTCAECGQSFITASKLGRHTKRIHLAIRFQCRICYRFFSKFDILTRHFDKAHKEEKLDGEPYDYNAILPYLKELEEQTKHNEKKEESIVEKNEDTVKNGEECDPDQKPKTEEIWDWSSHDNDDENKGTVIFGDNPYVVNTKEERIEMPDAPFEELPIENIVVEEVRVKLEIDVEAEKEREERTVAEDSFQDNCSDDDYFPSNTWAATPKIEMEPELPPVKTPYKRSDFPAKCEFCSKVIKTPSYYVIHLRTHSGEKPFKCYICDRGFITSSKMHRHVLTHTEQAGDGVPKVKNEVEEEIKKEPEEKKGNKKRKSKSKNSKKLSPGEIRRREKACRKRPFACPYCNKKFLHQDTLLVHAKCHDGEKLVLRCNFCLDEMESEEILKDHEKTHIGPKPFLCRICGRSYTKRENMIYHRKTHDTSKSGNSEYICDICSKRFNAQCKLQRHIVSHKVEKFVLRYECPVCAHMFNTKYHIQMHLNTHQKEGLILEENRNEILAMVMQNARKIPTKTDAVTSHADVIPADERSRVCNICGQVFQHFYYLEEHLKSHGSKIAIEDNSKDEEKKHICPICNKGFKLHYYLKLHSFTHSKEKPFICQSCGKGFITKGKLKRHLETHSGLKKYQCHICYKFFTRPSYLRIHVRTIHGTQDYNFRMDKQFGEKFAGQSF